MYPERYFFSLNMLFCLCVHFFNFRTLLQSEEVCYIEVAVDEIKVGEYSLMLHFTRTDND